MPRLAELETPCDLIDVFRASAHVPGHTDEILALPWKPRAVWLQEGIRDDASAARLEAAGIAVVQDRCIMVEHRRLLGAPRGERVSGRDRIVYSSQQGRMCPRCAKPVAQCSCTANPRAPRGDGVVRVRREVKGRNGKTVTTIAGVGLADDALRELGSELKRRCGTGGSVKDGVIEIQGDHRDALVAELEARGYTVKRAGG